MMAYSSLEEAYQMPLTGQKKKSSKVAAVETFAEETPAPVAPKKNPTPAGMLGERERVSYKAQLTDYDYICSTTGVCPLEEFKAPAQAKCEPLQPPKYEYPLNSADKEKFKKALQIALEQMEDGPKKPDEDMSKVAGLVDSEVESYMKLKDFKSIPLEAKIIPDERLKDIPGKETISLANAVPQVVQFTKENKGWMNLLLFMAAGVLIIFLLEQLFKLAMIIGLRRTVDVMDALLRDRSIAPAPASASV